MRALLSPVSHSYAHSDLHTNQNHLMLINTSSLTHSAVLTLGPWLKNLPAPSFLASWMDSLKGLLRRRITCLQLRKQPFDVTAVFPDVSKRLKGEFYSPLPCHVHFSIWHALYVKYSWTYGTTFSALSRQSCLNTGYIRFSWCLIILCVFEKWSLMIRCIWLICLNIWISHPGTVTFL